MLASASSSWYLNFLQLKMMNS